MTEQEQAEFDVLKAKVEYLDALCHSLMRVAMSERGQLMGISGKIEKELKPFWDTWLEKNRIEGLSQNKE